MANLQTLLTQMEEHHSLFEDEIRKLPVPVCKAFVKNGKIAPSSFKITDHVLGTKDVQKVDEHFKKCAGNSGNKVLEAVQGEADHSGLRIAVLFSGGPAAGGHNVIVGIKKAIGSKNTLLGTVAGPKGLLAGEFFEVTEDAANGIINTGGFDFLGSDRTKIKTDEQFAKVKKVVKEHKLDGIIVVGGDDSNTNAAVLAELLYDDGVKVIGVPKTIDGDLQIGSILPISFGYDTATKIYSEMVGNILQDTPSSRKYWHFIKLMGRSASHVALEVALQTKPALALISEEIYEKKMSLDQIVSNIANTISLRAASGINHGVILIPEGLIEFIPEMKDMITELNEVIAKYHEDLEELQLPEKKDFVYKQFSADSAKLMASLPGEIETMLLLERDSHGNLPVSQIPTENLMIQMVEDKLHMMQKHADDRHHLGLDEAQEAKFLKFKLSTLNHFFGYEGRCGAPTLFDAAYCLNLGLLAGSLVLDGHTCYIAAITELDKGGKALALPLTGLLNIERRHGADEMVIEKALVKINSPAFQFYEERRTIWARSDHFSSPGPRQLWGPTAHQLPYTVALNQGYGSLIFNLGDPHSLT
ncbi:MAG: diphosphate--fructose-6-phosphate 1-phosphotransferase [Spirochaetes bacterium GWF1_49_6]|nr:MAG: diphosphate--fructose-6-phosphate 1-phosphotransferase [Spirochaetes bacterium GWF1_49_6]